MKCRFFTMIFVCFVLINVLSVPVLAIEESSFMEHSQQLILF